MFRIFDWQVLTGEQVDFGAVRVADDTTETNALYGGPYTHALKGTWHHYCVVYGSGGGGGGQLYNLDTVGGWGGGYAGWSCGVVYGGGRGGGGQLYHLDTVGGGWRGLCGVELWCGVWWLWRWRRATLPSGYCGGGGGGYAGWSCGVVYGGRGGGGGQLYHLDTVGGGGGYEGLRYGVVWCIVVVEVDACNSTIWILWGGCGRGGGGRGQLYHLDTVRGVAGVMRGGAVVWWWWRWTRATLPSGYCGGVAGVMLGGAVVWWWWRWTLATLPSGYCGGGGGVGVMWGGAVVWCMVVVEVEAGNSTIYQPGIVNVSSRPTIHAEPVPEGYPIQRGGQTIVMVPTCCRVKG